MISAKERLKLLYKIIADAGDISSVDLHSELGKRLSLMEMQRAQLSQTPDYTPMASPQPPQTPISPSVGGMPTRADNGLQSDQIPPDAAQGLNTPPGM
jgi:hypothetical protein